MYICRSKIYFNDNITRRMRCACWITKTTDTHSEYVIVIVFPRQQWLCKCASMLRYTYIACLVINSNPPLLRYLYIPEELDIITTVTSKSSEISSSTTDSHFRNV
jgi:hypothetical protein